MSQMRRRDNSDFEMESLGKPSRIAKERKWAEVMQRVEKLFKASDCGASTGDPGFGEGNTCAEGRGSKARGSLGRSVWEHGGGQFKQSLSDKQKEAYQKDRPDFDANTEKTRETVKASKHTEQAVEAPEANAPKAADAIAGKKVHLSNGTVQPKNEEDFTPELAEYYAKIQDQADATSLHNEAIVEDVASQLTIDEMHDFLGAEGIVTAGQLWANREHEDWFVSSEEEGYLKMNVRERLSSMTRVTVSGGMAQKLDWRNLKPEEQEMYKRTLAAVVVAKERYLSGVDVPAPIFIEEMHPNTHGYFQAPSTPYGPGMIAINRYGKAHQDKDTIAAAQSYTGPAAEPPSRSAADVDQLVSQAKERLHYKRAWTVSSGSRVGTVIHEIGHALHYHNLMANENRSKFPRDGFTGGMEALAKTHRNMRRTTAWKEVAQFLPSGYSQSDPLEFVAECFTLKTMHPEMWRAMPEKLHDYYYDTLGGP